MAQTLNEEPQKKLPSWFSNLKKLAAMYGLTIGIMSGAFVAGGAYVGNSSTDAAQNKAIQGLQDGDRIILDYMKKQFDEQAKRDRELQRDVGFIIGVIGREPELAQPRQ